MNFRPIWLPLLTILSTPLAAQERTTGDLDPQVAEVLREVTARALRDSIPVRQLEDKALEGTAKQVPPARIADALRKLGTELADARSLLRQGGPTTKLSEGDIVAASDARRRGVPGEEIVALRRESPGASMVVPLTVLGELVDRGVPVGQARATIAAMLKDGRSMDQVAQLPGKVDVGIRVGASPAAALNSATSSNGNGNGGVGPGN